ncbi:sugar transporter [Candidatus Aerophobetes bacterium]|uniref:Sugar transporter n=1 Tax=Aerophobetes bacterium TaxID=2030807 RepID=A0A2A4YKY3_UNCAE|nr:MAG: sugar transporter [Candidatus Aerophobetes bacterium]
MRLVFAVLFLSLVVIFSSCSNPPYQGNDLYGADEFVLDSYKIKQGKFSILEMEGKPLGDLPDNLLSSHEDVIESGDVLNIAIYHPVRKDITDAVSNIGGHVGFTVRGGKITLPDLDAIIVAGLSLEDAREKIQNAYLAEIEDIEVFLSYKDRLEKRVELAGQVEIPSITVGGKTRLFDVLSKAKVPVNANLFKSYVVRGAHLLPVDMNRLMKNGDMGQNIVMKGGDKIYIADASASTVMMMGEVTQRGLINLPQGYLPLREALARAGGIPYTGDRAFIQVIRGNILKPKIYTLNWKHVIHLPTESMLLMPGDIVYVAATPITEWNRFISQLFPSFTAIDLFCKSMTGIITIR